MEESPPVINSSADDGMEYAVSTSKDLSETNEADENDSSAVKQLPEMKTKNGQKEDVRDQAIPREAIGQKGNHHTTGFFRCGDCLSVFYFLAELEKHRSESGHVGPSQCSVCSISFEGLSELENHSLIHAEKNYLYGCLQCRKVFAVLTQFQEHCKMHEADQDANGGDSLIAEAPTETDAVSNNTHANKKSAKIRKGPVSRKKKIQNRASSASTDLTENDITQSMESPYQCLHCPSIFVWMKDLTAHNVAEHAGRKPFQCQKCGASFTEMSKLRIHLKAHAGDRPYKCQFCPLSFVQRNRLNAHIRIHSGERTFECDQCPDKFKVMSAFRRHMKIHVGDRPWKCEYCNASFSSEMKAFRHMKVHARESKKCPVSKARNKKPQKNVDGTDHSLANSVKTKDVRSKSNAYQSTKEGPKYLSADIPVGKEQVEPVVAAASPGQNLVIKLEPTDSEYFENPQQQKSNGDDSPQVVTTGADTNKEKELPVPQDPVVTVGGPGQNLVIKLEPTDPDDFAAEHSQKDESISDVCQQAVTEETVSETKSSKKQRTPRKNAVRARGKITGNKKQVAESAQKNKSGSAGKTKSNKNGPSDKNLGMKAKLMPMLFKSPSQSLDEIDKNLKLFECGECGAQFGTISQLRFHVACHSAKTKMKCSPCQKEFTSVSGLYKHAAIHLPPREYTCLYCELKFPTRRQKIVHLKTHSGQKAAKPYKCSQCSGTFERPSRLEEHMRIHTNERPFKCEVCGAAFTILNHLKNHRKTHSKVRPFKCQVCPVAFHSPSKLKTHMRIHTGEKPYACDVCGAAFAQTSQLKNHTRIHTKDRPLLCELCPSSFTSQSSLSFHISTVHGQKAS